LHPGNRPILGSAFHRGPGFHQHIAAPIEIQVELDRIRPRQGLAAFVGLEQGKPCVEPGAIAAQLGGQNVQIRKEEILGLGVERPFVSVDLPAIAARRRLDQLAIVG